MLNLGLNVATIFPSNDNPKGQHIFYGHITHLNHIYVVNYLWIVIFINFSIIALFLSHLYPTPSFQHRSIIPQWLGTSTQYSNIPQLSPDNFLQFNIPRDWISVLIPSLHHILCQTHVCRANHTNILWIWAICFPPHLDLSFYNIKSFQLYLHFQINHRNKMY